MWSENGGSYVKRSAGGGYFQMDGQIYLLESKWEKEPLPEAPLLMFRGKIEGKSTFTRGVFVALSDISGPAQDAITRGKAPSFFVMNGHHLLMILSESISLTTFYGCESGFWQRKVPCAFPSHS